MIGKDISFDQILKVNIRNFALICLLLLSAFSFNSFGQIYPEYPYPTDVFANPLGIEWELSGTYGEPRSNHFHAGSDVKTNGTTGYKLYAIQDGYVARIKVSPFGYGKALYIAHPNGYTSVYGHMDSFNPKIDSLVKQYQYANQQFSQEIYPKASELKVKKGDLIGYSGNSGGSGGPHLHLEIRETASEQVLNPLFFGYKVSDNVPPTLSAIKLTTIPSDKSYYEVPEGKRYLLKKNSKGYYIQDTIEVAEGEIGVGVHGYDVQTAATNKNGIFRMELFVNDQPHFTWTMDKMSFDEARYVNAFRDFYEGKYGRTIYNCFRMPGNDFKIYEHQVKDGFIDSKGKEVIKVNIVAWDFHKNKSNIEFYLKTNPNLKPAIIQDSTAVLMPFNQNNNIIKEDFKAFFPEGSFYDDLPVTYRKEINSSATIFSDYHHLNNRLVPLHKTVVVQIAPKNIAPELKSKVVMMHKDLKGVEQALATFWKDDMISTKSKEVGVFYAKLDTVAPSISIINLNTSTKTFRENQIRVKITDNLSGIDTYDGYINDQWVVFDYDAKRNLLVYDFDDKMGKGEQTLKMVVKDAVGNVQTKVIPFIR
jgi:murein DD-endopeptidase MepM/ murein hydrolase activator NlpD